MTVEESAKVLAILKAAYPNHYRDMTKEQATGTINVWASQFVNIPVFVVMLAVNKHISSIKFPPTVSEVKDKIKSLYYETQETLRLHRDGYLELDDNRLSTLNAVLHEVERFRGNNPIEPSINELLDGMDKQYLLSGYALKGKKIDKNFNKLT